MMGATGRRGARISSVDELLAVAQALEREAAARYRDLSARMERQGDLEMAAQFNTLGEMEELHADEVADRGQSLLGRPPAPLRVGWEMPPGYDEEEARGATLGPYQALAFAVRSEERAFAFYAYVAAEAESSAVRALAEDLAREELKHAALLRRYRRRAFRAGPPVSVEIPPNVEILRTRAREWDAEAAAAHDALAKTLEDAGQTTDAAIFRRLAVEEESAASGTAARAVPNLRNVADGLRLLEDRFDRFAHIGEHSTDERIVAEAQRLASEIVARLALAGGAQDNSMLRLSY
jgi:rubrerythrin